MFSANPSISPIGLKPSDVAKEVGLARNGIRLGGTGSSWGERSRIGAGTGSDWAGTGVGLGKNADRTGWERGSDLRGTGSE